MTIGPFVTPFGATPLQKKRGGCTVLYNFAYCPHLCKAICRLKLQFNVASSPMQLLAAPFKHWFVAQHATCFECCATFLTWVPHLYRAIVVRTPKAQCRKSALALYRVKRTLHTSHNNLNGLLLPSTSRGHRDNDTQLSPSPNIGNAQHGAHRLRYSDTA